MEVMERRMKKYGLQASPERTKVWTEPPPPMKQQGYQNAKRVPVVYYLCRHHCLEHPHFIEVSLSSPEGLYLRDVISRLNVLRGKGMAARYSWSCKRRYRNGFVWHDLSGDDLAVPAHGNEYILKGSELLDQSPPDRAKHNSSNAKPPASYRTQEAFSSSSHKTEIKEAKPLSLPRRSPPSQEDELSPPPRSLALGSVTHPGWQSSSLSPVEYEVYKLNGTGDAWTQTQTDDRHGRSTQRTNIQIKGVSTEDSSRDISFKESFRNQTMEYKNDSEVTMAEISASPISSNACSSVGKTGTLGSLIRAEFNKMKGSRISGKDTVLVRTKARLKATSMFMQLITCRAISVKDHRSYGHTRFPSPMFASSVMMGELDCLSNNSRMMELRLEEKEYFSGSLIGTKQQEEAERGTATHSCSSFNTEDRMCNPPNPVGVKEKIEDSAHSKCFPRRNKLTSSKQSKNGTMMSTLSDGPKNFSALPDYIPSVTPSSSNGGSRRIADTSSARGLSMRLESFKRENEKVIKIKERLASGAQVIIQSTAPCDQRQL